jgi:putative radical SAM enzyme (TIGR03279 family)
LSIRITQVLPGSIADELGIRVGDELFAMNGEAVRDELDVKFHMPGETLELEVMMHPEGAPPEYVVLDVEKEYDEEVGFVVEPMKMTACGNDCVFCFVDQNPEGLRKALYFRDGDYRFSHLFGNYNTMTNVGPKSLERIVRQRLMPQYVSVHSTDLEVRKKLMRLRKDDHIMDKLRYLAENGIWTHGQVVLCPGINDGESLKKTVEDIYSLGPTMLTMAIVPVGLTSHRSGLTELTQIDKQYARDLIAWVFELQKRFRAERDANWLYLSDEFFLTAEMEVPNEEWYDGYPQLENGVGMVRDFIEETRKEVNVIKQTPRFAERKSLTLATGTLASSFMQSDIAPILREIPNLDVDVQVVVNQLYGPDVTVTGLLSGRCFDHHFKNTTPSDLLLLPPNVLNEDDIFLDDESPLGLKAKLGNRPMAIFHGSWEEVMYYIENPYEEAFDAAKIKLPVLS